MAIAVITLRLLLDLIGSRVKNGMIQLTTKPASRSGSQPPLLRWTYHTASSGMLPYQIRRYWQTHV